MRWVRRLLILCCAISFWNATYADVAEMSLMHWTTYRSHHLGILVAAPSTWTARISSQAVGFRVRQKNGSYAAYGVMKSVYFRNTLEENADLLYKHEGKPKQWVRQPAIVAGRRAIKIIFTPRKTPSIQIVQYYVKTVFGTYLVQCIAPKREWVRYGPIFATAIKKIEFQLPK